MWSKFLNGELYVDLNSKEEMKHFLNQCADRGLRWASGEAANKGAVVRYFQSRMLVVYKENSYDSGKRALFFATSEPLNKKIIKWGDYMKRKNFTKADFESGMVVECRNGERYLVLRDKLLNNKHWNSISDDYTPELKMYENGVHQNDIMKIYDTIGVTNLHNIFDDENLIIIWERQEIKEMTVAEIEKELGYNIKIVK